MIDENPLNIHYVKYLVFINKSIPILDKNVIYSTLKIYIKIEKVFQVLYHNHNGIASS